jgi:hypothetical protein
MTGRGWLAGRYRLLGPARHGRGSHVRTGWQSAERDQRVHQYRQQGNGSNREEGGQHPAARRPEDGRQAGAAECGQARGERRIIIGQLALNLSEDALLFHGKRHGATSA